MRRRSEHSSQMVISEGLPHILQTWCACSSRGSDRRGAIFMLCLLSNLSTRSIEQQPCSARAIHHYLLRSWHQVRFALKAERQMSLLVIVTPFCHRPRNLIGRQQCHCGCAVRTQRTHPAIVSSSPYFELPH